MVLSSCGSILWLYMAQAHFSQCVMSEGDNFASTIAVLSIDRGKGVPLGPSFKEQEGI